VRKQKKMMRNWVWDMNEVSNKIMEQNKQDVFLGASDSQDFITSEIHIARNKTQAPTYHAEVTVLATANEWGRYLESTDLRLHAFRSGGGLCFDDEAVSYMAYDINSSSVIVKLFGNKAFVDRWFKDVTSKFEQVKNVIEWLYSSDGQSIEVPLRTDRIPVNEMYPWLEGENLAEYYDRFMHSDASILLLIGPPGTGKTTFIRGLLQHTEQSAIVTYDAAILSKDYVFAQFIEGDRNIMVIEDADNFLGARTDGNDIMHKFLNVGDGLVTTKNKKLIFSTNLPSIKDVDSALIRPGRCFDIVNFAPLKQVEAEKLAEKLKVNLDGERDNWSIADIFHKQIQAPKTPKRKMGFV
jgi:molybdopterin-guanine dinucleotide biosynthesis protein